MFKDMSKITMWYIWMVTYLRRNVTIVRGTSYHLLGSQISWDSKIRIWLQVECYISDWQYSESRHLASYVSHHNAMAYDRVENLESRPRALMIHFVKPCCRRVSWMLFHCISTPRYPFAVPSRWRAISSFWSCLMSFVMSSLHRP